MPLFLVNSEQIYFSQTKAYFKEIVSSYDNGNYRSAMVMLYSTIVCDLLLKLKELSDVYSDTKAEEILEDINQKRAQANSSEWEWKLIERIRKETELLNDETYMTIKHIYGWRNFSAHPAMNADYELISPSPELTIGYIKKSLEDIFVKPSVFAQNIVNRMSDDIASKREIYREDGTAFKKYLKRVYFERMSDKMFNQVFRAFWKFAFMRSEGDDFVKNRVINRCTLSVMLDERYELLCKYIKENQSYFSVTNDKACVQQLMVILAHYPNVYYQLDDNVKYIIDTSKYDGVELFRWFKSGDIYKHIETVDYTKDSIKANVLSGFKCVCEGQGVPQAFRKYLITHYSKSAQYRSAKVRFDECVEPYLDQFSAEDIIELIETINGNRQIYEYFGQKSRNNTIMNYAKKLLPEDFDYTLYPNFKFDQEEENDVDDVETNSPMEEDDLPF